MESWVINNRTLEYDDETHTYLVDGIIVPSVTQLLGRKFGHKYDDVDAGVLRKAAERGTMIHKAIEDYCKSGVGDSIEVKDFAFLQKYHKFTVVQNELPIILDIGGDTFACTQFCQRTGQSRQLYQQSQTDRSGMQYLSGKF